MSRPRFQLQRLEDRATPAVITVTGTGDTIAVDGFVTLREAITAANTNAPSGDAPAGSAGLDLIKFKIAGLPGTVHTIKPLGALPTITDRITIDGYSQLGASANTLTEGSNAFLAIELDGSLGGFHAGLTIIADNCIVQGLVINNFKNEGILVLGDNSVIRGNFLGTDATGKLDRGNGITGVSLLGSNNTVGGLNPGNRNLISGNEFAGIAVTNASTTDSVIQGNLIGTKDDGVTALGNTGAGVRIFSASNTTIGGTAAGAANVIAFNSAHGVQLANDASSGHAILGNRIFGNGGLAIEIGSDGPTANDSLDADSGPNGRQNFPEVKSVVSRPTGTTIRGRLDSTPNAAFRVELYSSDVGDPTGFGEMQRFLGFVTVNTNDQGRGEFSFATASAVTAGQIVAATATDANGNTSEAAAFRVAVQAVPLFATGAGAGGGSHVNVYNADGSERFSFLAYLGFTGGVRVATADVTGDGIDDIITGAGATGGPHVQVFDGETDAAIGSFLAFDPSFTGGVHVDASDINGDGRADVIVGAGAGGGPHVKVFSGAADNAELESFLAYDAAFLGGVFVG